MTTQKHFTIDKVSWHTSTIGNECAVPRIHNYFRSIISFLQKNGLVNDTILSETDEISDDVAIISDNLTEDGLELMKKSYDKWLKRVDKGMSPTDVTILEKELAKIRTR